MTQRKQYTQKQKVLADTQTVGEADSQATLVTLFPQTWLSPCVPFNIWPLNGVLAIAPRSTQATQLPLIPRQVLGQFSPQEALIAHALNINPRHAILGLLELVRQLVQVPHASLAQFLSIVAQYTNARLHFGRQCESARFGSDGRRAEHAGSG